MQEKCEFGLEREIKIEIQTKKKNGSIQYISINDVKQDQIRGERGYKVEHLRVKI